MAIRLTEALEQEIERVVASYDADFAGQERATRDLNKLADLTRRLREVVAQLDALPAASRDSAFARLFEDARSRLAAYEGEHEAIVRAKAAGPELGEFSRLASFANMLFAVYSRHFAGKPRASRDHGLLSELVQELGAISQRMKAILAENPGPDYRRDADLVDNMAQRYKAELREITAAAASGTAFEQASLLATLANAQFELYRAHFAGQARQTRRPALLQRIIANLRRIRAAMRDLRATGAAAKSNQDNADIVDSSLRSYETELAAIRRMRQAAPIADLLGALGGAANELFAEYRKKFSGQDRRAVDLEALGIVNDKLGEIARQMTDLGRTEHSEMNERNLGIVMEQLLKFEQEYVEIAKLQSPD